MATPGKFGNGGVATEGHPYKKFPYGFEKRNMNTLSIQELRVLFDNLRGRVDQLGRFL